MSKDRAARLPSLSALRAFEAAARHQSFKGAAEELCLSQSAVSRAIRELEEQLGVAVFERAHRLVRLTEAGERMAPDVCRAFGYLRRGVEQALTASSGLRLGVTPFFVGEWIYPRLSDFEARHPDVPIELVSEPHDWHNTEPVQHGHTDAAVVLGSDEQWRGLNSFPLLPPLDFTPMCSPRLLADGKGLSRPEALAAYTWLTGPQVPWAWDWYLEQLGLAGLEPARRVHFDSFVLYFAAVRHGKGIGILPKITNQGWLRAGQLAVALDRPVRHPSFNYYCVWRRGEEPRPELRDFLAWLRAQTLVEVEPRTQGSGKIRP